MRDSPSLDAHIDALQAAMGITFKDRSGVATAMRGLVDSCMGEGEEEIDDSEGEPMPEMRNQGKGEGQGKMKGITLGVMLGGKKS